MATAEDILNFARAELGTKENPPDSNNVKYNDWYWHKKDGIYGASYPWCAVFVSYVFAHVDASLCKRTASCMEMGNWFKAKGQWSKSNPESGDVVFFKYSTNSRWTNHVGIVESVGDGCIYTIEGNTSTSSNDNGGCVMRRLRKSQIVGYGKPSYNKNVNVFPKCTNDEASFVDALKSINVNSSLAYRKQIALANGFSEYKASAEQNMVLLNRLKLGKLLKP